MSTENISPTPTETVMGGLNVIVTHSDKGTDTVFVRQLAIEDYPKLLQAQDDECKMIELYCDRPIGWAKTLSPDSHEKLVEEGERLNSDFFLRWVQRRISRQERLLPGITQRMRDAALSASQTSQPNTPRPAA